MKIYVFNQKTEYDLVLLNHADSMKYIWNFVCQNFHLVCTNCN